MWPFHDHLPWLGHLPFCVVLLLSNVKRQMPMSWLCQNFALRQKVRVGWRKWNVCCPNFSLLWPNYHLFSREIRLYSALFPAYYVRYESTLARGVRGWCSPHYSFFFSDGCLTDHWSADRVTRFCISYGQLCATFRKREIIDHRCLKGGQVMSGHRTMTL